MGMEVGKQGKPMEGKLLHPIWLAVSLASYLRYLYTVLLFILSLALLSLSVQDTHVVCSTFITIPTLTPKLLIGSFCLVEKWKASPLYLLNKKQSPPPQQSSFSQIHCAFEWYRLSDAGHIRSNLFFWTLRRSLLLEMFLHLSHDIRYPLDQHCDVWPPEAAFPAHTGCENLQGNSPGRSQGWYLPGPTRHIHTWEGTENRAKTRFGSWTWMKAWSILGSLQLRTLRAQSCSPPYSPMQLSELLNQI